MYTEDTRVDGDSGGSSSIMNARPNKVEERKRTRFIDGAEYTGTWNPFGIEGIGRYLLPHNAVFEGEFRDGSFHGHGTLYWPRGQRIDGLWFKGECKDERYTFHDGLIFEANGWKYCQFPDRRFHTCLKNGLRPAGATLRANDRNDILIPPMCYDAGIGIFDPRSHCITSYRDPAKVLEIPSPTVARWIESKCQKAWIEPTGHRKDIHENWFSQKVNEPHLFPASLPFSDKSFEPWWKRYEQMIKQCCNFI